MGLEIGILAGGDEIEIAFGSDAQAQLPQPVADDFRTPDQQGPRDALGDRLLGDLEHALVLALGEDHALGRHPGLIEHRLHGHPGAEGAMTERPTVSVEIGDRPGRDPAFQRFTAWREADMSRWSVSSQRRGSSFIL
jgi:hypothetical protein